MDSVRWAVSFPKKKTPLKKWIPYIPISAMAYDPNLINLYILDISSDHPQKSL